jgi:putative phosphoesterase
MKLAIVSDVHGNLAALEAVLEDLSTIKPDLIVNGGDVATNGPHPAECVDRIRELGWPGIAGNVDLALWWLPETLPDDLMRTFRTMVPVTANMLGAERVAWLKTMPLEWRDSHEIALVHAVPGDTWKVVLPTASDQELQATYGLLGARLAIYCHIHKPYVRQLDGFTVANTGSVGLPWDGDTRSSYLLIEDGVPAIRRVIYDVERHIADVERSGYPTSRWLIEQARTAKGGLPQLNG